MKLKLLISLVMILLSSCTQGGAPATGMDESSSGANRSSGRSGSSSASGTEDFYVDGLLINPDLDTQSLFFTAYEDPYSTQMAFHSDTVIFKAELPQGNYQLSFSADGYDFIDLPAGSATAKNATAPITIQAKFPKDITDTTFTFRIRSTESATAPNVDEQYEINIPWQTIPSAFTMAQGGIFTYVNESALDVSQPYLYASRDSQKWARLKTINTTLPTFFLPDSGDYQFLAVYERRNMECVVCSGSYTSSKLTGFVYYVSPILSYTSDNHFRLIVEDDLKHFEAAKISIELHPIFEDDSLIQIQYSRDSLAWDFYGKSSTPWLSFLVPQDSATFFVKASFDTLGHHFESNTVRVSDYIIGLNCKAQADSIYVTWTDRIWDTTFVYLGTSETEMLAVDTLLPIPDHSPWDYDRMIGFKRIGTGTNYCQTEHKYSSSLNTHKSTIKTILPLVTP